MFAFEQVEAFGNLRANRLPSRWCIGGAGDRVSREASDFRAPAIENAKAHFAEFDIAPARLCRIVHNLDAAQQSRDLDAE